MSALSIRELMEIRADTVRLARNMKRYAADTALPTDVRYHCAVMVDDAVEIIADCGASIARIILARAEQ